MLLALSATTRPAGRIRCARGATETDGDVVAHDGLAFTPVPPSAAEEPDAAARGEGQEWSSPATEGPCVLIVDDEEPIRLLCRVNLRLAGMKTLEAANGHEALRLARSAHPDLILLDVMMPRLDGWEVATELARDAGTRDIPVVFVSARADPADHAHGYEVGAVGYITKPFDPVELTETVRDVLARVERGEGAQLREERRRRLGHEPG
jgi:CheY-like chemotaxis protein